MFNEGVILAGLDDRQGGKRVGSRGELVTAVGGYDVVALKQHLAAITIVFDVVNPVLALWRLVDRGSKLALNEPEPRGVLKTYSVGAVRFFGRGLVNMPRV